MSHIKGSFKMRFPLDKRTEEAKRIREKYPDRIPVIVEQTPKNDDFPKLDKQKYLVPGDLTLGQFSYVLRKRLKLKPDKAMFILINNQMMPTSSNLINIYNKEKSECGFLFVEISGESIFGA